MDQGVIVFCDVDGTLLTSRQEVSPQTRNAILQLQAKGIPFVIVTGRSPSAVYPIFRRYGFWCPVIGFNGGIIVEEDESITHDQCFSRETAQAVLDFVQREGLNVSPSIYAKDEWVVPNRQDERVLREERIVHLTATEGDLATVRSQQINKILLIADDGQATVMAESVQKAFPYLAVGCSTHYQAEVMPLGINKAEAVKDYCLSHGYDLSQAIAIGDNYNDLEMLSLVGRAVVMGNAPQPIQDRFSFVTLDNDHDGIPYALSRLIP